MLNKILLSFIVILTGCSKSINFSEINRSVVKISRPDRCGSGFVVGATKSNTYIMSSAHLFITGMFEGFLDKVGFACVPIEMYDGTLIYARFPYSIVYIDPKKDLAIIKIIKVSAPPLQLDTNFSLAQRVYVFGNPLGLENHITTGVVSKVLNFNNNLYIESDALIHGGNSGGPMVNEQGRVIAITEMKHDGLEMGLYLLAKEFPNIQEIINNDSKSRRNPVYGK